MYAKGVVKSGKNLNAGGGLLKEKSRELLTNSTSQPNHKQQVSWGDAGKVEKKTKEKGPVRSGGPSGTPRNSQHQKQTTLEGK